MSDRIPDFVTIHQTPGTKLLVVYCGRCEGALRLAVPINVVELVEATRQFGKRHAECTEPERPKDPRRRDLF
jgi:hypothetical protein